MLASEFVNELARARDWDPREVERYARYLREARLFPDRVGGRRTPITVAFATNLLIAVAAADNATKAADAVERYSPLRSDRVAIGKTLGEFVNRILDSARKDAKMFHAAKLGTLSFRNGAPGAVFRGWQGHWAKGTEIIFRGPGSPLPRIVTETHVSGDLLASLSITIADLPQPKHLAGWKGVSNV